MFWNHSSRSSDRGLADRILALHAAVVSAADANDLEAARAPMKELQHAIESSLGHQDACALVADAADRIARAAVMSESLDAAEYGFRIAGVLLDAHPGDERIARARAAAAHSVANILSRRGDFDQAAQICHAIKALPARSDAGRRDIALWHARTAATCVVPRLASGDSAVRQACYRLRDGLFAPDLYDDIAAHYGRGQADDLREKFAANVDAWLIANPGVAARGAGRVLEHYDIDDRDDLPLWNGALKLRLPRRYTAKPQSTTRIVCDEPGIDFPSVTVAVVSVGSSDGQDPVSSAWAAQGCLMSAFEDLPGRHYVLRRDARADLAPGIYAEHEARSDEVTDGIKDWIKERNWYLLRAGRRTIFIMAIHVVTAVFQEYREDVRAFLGQFEETIATMTLDADLLCREAGLE